MSETARLRLDGARQTDQGLYLTIASTKPLAPETLTCQVVGRSLQSISVELANAGVAPGNPRSYLIPLVKGTPFTGIKNIMLGGTPVHGQIKTSERLDVDPYAPKPVGKPSVLKIVFPHK